RGSRYVGAPAATEPRTPPAAEVDGGDAARFASRCVGAAERLRIYLVSARQTSTAWRPLYIPHTVQAACGSFGDLQFGQATVTTAVAFQLARRDRVLLRDILRLGTATAGYSLKSFASDTVPG